MLKHMLRFDKKEKKKETKGSKSLLIKDRVIINNKMQGEGNHIDTDKSSTGMRVTLPHINLNYLSNANKANKAYCYIINSLNNKEMIRHVLNSRKYWKEAESVLTTNYHLKITSSNKNSQYCLLNKANPKMINHFEYEMEICNKQSLFINFYNYCADLNINAFDYIPMTVLLRQNDARLENFSFLYLNLDNLSNGKCKYEDVFLNGKNTSYAEHSLKTQSSSNLINIPKTHYDGKNIWLVKPPDLCKGKCIQICDSLSSIEKSVKDHFGGVNIIKAIKVSQITGEKVFIKYRPTTLLLQKYVERPLLYKGRKFDIRMWVLISHKLDVYLFKEGHLKTTSHQYDLSKMNKFVHLTNYSLQKQDNENFSKYEEGNEVSLNNLKKELQDDKLFDQIFKQIIEIVKLSTQAIGTKINKKKRMYCYVLLGYDFIVDCEFKVWLLEINRNPGLSESSKLIKILIPRLLHDTFKITIDELFPTEYSQAFPIEGYKDEENLFLHIHNLNSYNMLR